MDPKWNHWSEAMPVNLSIKNVPDDLAESLRERARLAHRSLQGELLVILGEAIRGRESMSPFEFLSAVRELGVETGADADDAVRSARDAR
jgi:plasmid stability protein